MLKLIAVALSSAVLGLGLVACGSSKKTTTATTPATTAPATTAPSGTAAPAGALSLAADPSGALKYNKTALSAKAGKVTISFTNTSPLMHNVTIQQGTNGKILGATPTFQGGTKTLTLNLPAGTYTFFCSVPGHRMAGMQGTLTVH